MKCEIGLIESARTGYSGGATDHGLGCAPRRVRAVPMSEEGSARTSGAYTSYGDAIEVRVCASCADYLRGPEWDCDRDDGYLAIMAIYSMRRSAAARKAHRTPSGRFAGRKALASA